MNFLGKKAILKLISKSLVVTSILGIGVTYNLVFNENNTAYAFGGLDVLDTTSTGFKEISAGDYQAFFVKNNGEVINIGSNTNTPIKLSVSNVKKVSSGRDSTVLLKNDGTVWAYGWNVCGQLGIGNTQGQSSPVKVNINDVKEVDSGAEYTAYLKNDGTVWAAGNFTTTNSNVPVNTGINNIKKIICGRYHCILVRNDNTLLMYKTMGASKKDITDFKYSDLKQIVCQYDTTVFLKNDGTAWFYGDNGPMYELGSYFSSGITDSIKKIPITNVAQIALGKRSSFFVKNDGTVWGCGYNDCGQLGIGKITSEAGTFVKASITNVKQVVSGSTFTIFIKGDGTIWFVGDVGTYNSTTPILISNSLSKF